MKPPTYDAIYAYCSGCGWHWWKRQYDRYGLTGRAPVCFAYPTTGLSGLGCIHYEPANPVGMTAQTWLEEGVPGHWDD